MADNEHDVQNQPADEAGGSVPTRPDVSMPEGAPEPPPSWRPSDATADGSKLPVYDNRTLVPNQPNNGSFPGDPLASKIIDIRKKVSIAQACAIVSLFFGGVFLSTVSLVFAILAWFAYRSQFQDPQAAQEHGRAIRRSILITIGMAVVALVVNAISLVVLYPVLMEMLETGDFSALGFGAHQGASSGSGTSAWG